MKILFGRPDHFQFDNRKILSCASSPGGCYMAILFRNINSNQTDSGNQSNQITSTSSLDDCSQELNSISTDSFSVSPSSNPTNLSNYRQDVYEIAIFSTGNREFSCIGKGVFKSLASPIGKTQNSNLSTEWGHIIWRLDGRRLCVLVPNDLQLIDIVWIEQENGNERLYENINSEDSQQHFQSILFGGALSRRYESEFRSSSLSRTDALPISVKFKKFHRTSIDLIESIALCESGKYLIVMCSGRVLKLSWDGELITVFFANASSVSDIVSDKLLSWKSNTILFYPIYTTADSINNDIKASLIASHVSMSVWSEKLRLLIAIDSVGGSLSFTRFSHQSSSPITSTGACNIFMHLSSCAQLSHQKISPTGVETRVHVVAIEICESADYSHADSQLLYTIVRGGGDTCALLLSKVEIHPGIGVVTTSITSCQIPLISTRGTELFQISMFESTRQPIVITNVCGIIAGRLPLNPEVVIFKIDAWSAGWTLQSFYIARGRMVVSFFESQTQSIDSNADLTTTTTTIFSYNLVTSLQSLHSPSQARNLFLVETDGDCSLMEWVQVARDDRKETSTFTRSKVMKDLISATASASTNTSSCSDNSYLDEFLIRNCPGEWRRTVLPEKVRQECENYLSRIVCSTSQLYNRHRHRVPQLGLLVADSSTEIHLGSSTSRMSTNSLGYLAVVAGGSDIPPPRESSRGNTEKQTPLTLWVYNKSTKRWRATHLSLEPQSHTNAVIVCPRDILLPLSDDNASPIPLSSISGSLGGIVNIAWFNEHTVAFISIRKSRYCIEILSREVSRESLGQGKPVPILHKIVVLPVGFIPTFLDIVSIDNKEIAKDSNYSELAFSYRAEKRSNVKVKQPLHHQSSTQYAQTSAVISIGSSTNVICYHLFPMLHDNMCHADAKHPSSAHTPGNMVHVIDYHIIAILDCPLPQKSTSNSNSTQSKLILPPQKIVVVPQLKCTDLTFSFNLQLALIDATGAAYYYCPTAGVFHLLHHGPFIDINIQYLSNGELFSRNLPTHNGNQITALSLVSFVSSISSSSRIWIPELDNGDSLRPQLIPLPMLPDEMSHFSNKNGDILFSVAQNYDTTVGTNFSRQTNDCGITTSCKLESYLTSVKSRFAKLKDDTSQPRSMSQSFHSHSVQGLSMHYYVFMGVLSEIIAMQGKARELLRDILKKSFSSSNSDFKSLLLSRYQSICTSIRQSVSILRAWVQSIRQNPRNIVEIFIEDVEYRLRGLTMQQGFRNTFPEYRVMMCILYEIDKNLLIDIISRVSRKLEPTFSQKLFPIPINVSSLHGFFEIPHTGSDLDVDNTSKTVELSVKLRHISLSPVSLFEDCLVHKQLHHASRLITLACEYMGGTEDINSTEKCLVMILELLYETIRVFSLQLTLECFEFAFRLESILDCIHHAPNDTESPELGAGAIQRVEFQNLNDNSNSNNMVLDEFDLDVMQLMSCQQSVLNSIGRRLVSSFSIVSPALSFFVGGGALWALTQSLGNAISLLNGEHEETPELADSSRSNDGNSHEITQENANSSDDQPGEQHENFEHPIAAGLSPEGYKYKAFNSCKHLQEQQSISPIDTGLSLQLILIAVTDMIQTKKYMSSIVFVSSLLSSRVVREKMRQHIAELYQNVDESMWTNRKLSIGDEDLLADFYAALKLDLSLANNTNLPDKIFEPWALVDITLRCSEEIRAKSIDSSAIRDVLEFASSTQVDAIENISQLSPLQAHSNSSIHLCEPMDGVHLLHFNLPSALKERWGDTSTPGLSSLDTIDSTSPLFQNLPTSRSSSSSSSGKEEGLLRQYCLYSAIKTLNVILICIGRKKLSDRILNEILHIECEGLDLATLMNIILSL